MKLVKISAAAALVCAVAVSVHADDAKPKRELKGNMMEVYNTLPSSVDNLGDAFTQGVAYGRLRMNAFKWDWKAEDTSSNKDNNGLGLGGSFIYKTAPFAGVSATAGLYYADSPLGGIREDDADVGTVKAGKDTFSRYDVSTTGNWSMASLAQAYIQYDVSKTSFKAGRQIFESFLTKSNDTKMIPNTFEGYVVETKEVPDTKIRGAYFYAQKLRDHTTFHDVLTFKDAAGSSWNNNDDAAVHKGLTHAKLLAAGKETDNKLIVVDVQNKSVKNLQLDFTYGLVPGLISSATAEVNYAIDLGGMVVTPGARYMKQMDNGAGEVGGAGLSGTVSAVAPKGYKDGASLDSSLVMARLVAEGGPLKAQVGYSAVADEGDIVAPWRGFPTGGYTRAMAQYNWRANTNTMAAEVKYNFGKAKLIPGFTAMARYAMQDFDESKQAGGVQADSNILHMDFIQKIATGLEAKVRVGLVSAKEREAGGDKDSYNEYRFEVNYLF